MGASCQLCSRHVFPSSNPTISDPKAYFDLHLTSWLHSSSCSATTTHDAEESTQQHNACLSKGTGMITSPRWPNTTSNKHARMSCGHVWQHQENQQDKTQPGTPLMAPRLLPFAPFQIMSRTTSTWNLIPKAQTVRLKELGRILSFPRERHRGFHGAGLSFRLGYVLAAHCMWLNKGSFKDMSQLEYVVCSKPAACLLDSFPE